MHSIIITHRDRNGHLDLCLWSIHRSARTMGICNYEVVVVDNGSQKVPRGDGERVRVIADGQPMPVFCKPRLNNLGIESARGQVLTFLDADAIVGLRWMEGAGILKRDPSITRLCYRVRYLPRSMFEALRQRRGREQLVDRLFADYDKFDLAWEAYGRPEHNRPGPGQPHGNSQYSIRRDVLGELRYDEHYIGRCFEDLEFNRRIYRHYGHRYRADILTEPAAAMFHLKHPRDPGWHGNAHKLANTHRFKTS